MTPQVIRPLVALDDFELPQLALGGAGGLAEGDGVGVEEMGPRKGPGPRVGARCAQDVACDHLGLLEGVVLELKHGILTRAGIHRLHAIPAGKDAGNIGLQVLVDADAAFDFDAGGLGQGFAGHDSGRDHHGVARDAALVRDDGGNPLRAFDAQHLLRGQNPNPIALKAFLESPGAFRIEEGRQNPVEELDDGHLVAPLFQGLAGLDADRARADHDRRGSAGLVQPVGFGELLAAVDSRCVDACDGGDEEAAPVRQHQPVVAEDQAFFGGGVAGLRVDRRHPLLEEQVDVVRTVVIQGLAEDGLARHIAVR